MPSYTQYMRQMAVMDADDDNIETWITVKGNHIPIMKGQSKEDAVKSFIERKKGVANEIVERVHGHTVGGWIGGQKEHHDLFYRKENGEVKSNEEMHKFAQMVETEVRKAPKTPKFKDSVFSAHSIAMGDLQKQMPESMKKTFTPERHKELMEKKFEDKDTDVISGNWRYANQYRNEFFDKEGNWADPEAEKRYEYITNVEKKFDEIYEKRKLEAMQHVVNNLKYDDLIEKKEEGTPVENPTPEEVEEAITRTFEKETEKREQRIAEREKKELQENPKQVNSFSDFFNNMNAGLQPFLEMTGYEPKTTFWSDFSIAEAVGGEKAIKDTYERAFKEWKDNKEYITELVMMLNWKIWHHDSKGNDSLARLYNDLWGKADEWCMKNLKGEDLKYFLRTTD